MITASAQGREFTFPDGTTQAQIGKAIDHFFSSQAPQQAQATQTAQPEQQQEQPREPSFAESLGDPFADNEGVFSDERAAEIGRDASGLVNQAGQGLTFQFLDEAQGAALALAGKVLPESAGGLPSVAQEDGSRRRPTFNEARTGIRDAQRERNKEFSTENPKTAIAANIAGGLVTGGAGVVKGVSSQIGKKFSSKVVAGGAIGATEGAITGLGSTEAEDAKGVLKDVATNTVGGLVLGGAAGGVIQKFENRAKGKEALKNLIQNNPDARTAGLFVDSKGAIKKSKAVAEASRQGFDGGVLSDIRGATGADKAAATRMIKLAIAGQRSGKARIGGASNPARVIGETAGNRYKFLADERKKAGQELDKIVNSDEFNNSGVNGSEVLNSFNKTLSDAGVANSNGKFDFSQSDFADASGSTSLINSIQSKISRTDATNAKQLHELKNFIDKRVNFGKKDLANVVEGEAEDIAKGLRRGINELLSSASDSYKSTNGRFVTAIEATNKIDDLLGKNGGESLETSLGILSRRLTSNAISNGRVNEAFTELDEAALSLGGKFKEDFRFLASFSNELERRLGSFSRTSLQGQGENVAFSATKDAAQGNILDAGAKIAGSVINKTRGVSDEAALISIRKLLAEK